MVLYTGALIVGGVYHMMWRYAGGPRAVPADVFVRRGHGRGSCMQPRVRLEDAAFAVLSDRHLRFSTGGRVALWLEDTARGVLCPPQRPGAQPRAHRRRGRGGAYAARACQEGRHLSGAPVAFVDDDRKSAACAFAASPCSARWRTSPIWSRKRASPRSSSPFPASRATASTRSFPYASPPVPRAHTRRPGAVKERPVDGRQAFREVNTSDFLSRDEVTLDMDSIRAT